MANTHLVLGSKGGTGKSLAATQGLAAYFTRKGLPTFCYDTDPLNQTMGGYRAFQVKTIPLMDQDTRTINTRRFDIFLEEDLLTLPVGAQAVVDNGSSTYLPWCAYMAENPVIPMLQSQGTVFFHTVLTGGQALQDTYDCFEELVTQFPNSPFVVWLNRYFGPVEQDGVPFEQSALFKTHKDKIHAFVHIPHLNKDTYGKDIEMLLANRQTVDEVQAQIRNPEATGMRWGRMAAQRLNIFQNMLVQELDRANIL